VFVPRQIKDAQVKLNLVRIDKGSGEHVGVCCDGLQRMVPPSAKQHIKTQS